MPWQSLGLPTGCRSAGARFDCASLSQADNRDFKRDLHLEGRQPLFNQDYGLDAHLDASRDSIERELGDAMGDATGDVTGGAMGDASGDATSHSSSRRRRAHGHGHGCIHGSHVRGEASLIAAALALDGGGALSPPDALALVEAHVTEVTIIDKASNSRTLTRILTLTPTQPSPLSRW